MNRWLSGGHKGNHSVNRCERGSSKMPVHLERIESDRYIERIFEGSLGRRVRQAERFALGLSHYVFEVATEDNDTYVVRIARPQRRSELEDGLYWQARLQPLGVPLPRLYQHGDIEGYRFAIYQRLPGSDLEAVYPDLSPGTRRKIARRVAEIQQTIHTLDDRRLRAAAPWPEMVLRILDRSEREIGQRDRNLLGYVDQVRQTFGRHEAYLAAVRPVAFLYDACVRNVIVSEGRVSGVIDVDEVWYGDPLLAVGRGKTILRLMEQETDYITYWAEWLNLSEFQLRIVDLYALLYCVRFMGTLGQRLNGNKSVQTDLSKAGLLEELTRSFLSLGESTT